MFSGKEVLFCSAVLLEMFKNWVAKKKKL